jgi:hypothetical protein
MAAHRGKFVAYFRISTDKQGKSGLGLEAQREGVMAYFNGGPWNLGKRRKPRGRALVSLRQTCFRS